MRMRRTAPCERETMRMRGWGRGLWEFMFLIEKVFALQ